MQWPDTGTCGISSVDAEKPAPYHRYGNGRRCQHSIHVREPGTRSSSSPGRIRREGHRRRVVPVVDELQRTGSPAGARTGSPPDRSKASRFSRSRIPKSTDRSTSRSSASVSNSISSVVCHGSSSPSLMHQIGCEDAGLRRKRPSVRLRHPRKTTSQVLSASSREAPNTFRKRVLIASTVSSRLLVWKKRRTSGNPNRSVRCSTNEPAMR